jgi:type IV pilus assembly protein PilA
VNYSAKSIILAGKVLKEHPVKFMVRQPYGFEKRAGIAAGFSLIELLIVVAIILVIAAIAIPNMIRAKMSANESSAASSIRQISRAEMAYYAAYPDHGYADALANLSGPQTNCLPSSTTACIIDPDLAAGHKSGYSFSSPGVLPSGGVNTSFVAAAAPVTFNSSGTKDFCSVADGVLRAQTGAAGNVPATDPTICVAFPSAN